MKKIILLIVSIFLCSYTFAQEIRPQFDATILEDDPVISVDKGNLLKDVNIIANMRFASNTNFANSHFENSDFKMNEFRLEVVGKVTDKISFRFRDVYMSRAVDAGTTDQLRHSIDLAYVGYAFSPEFSLTAGKMLSEWGSYELDINPVYMYAYNDMIQYGDFFLSGIRANWKATPDHNFSLQIVNSNTRSFDTRYGTTPDVEAARIPLGATVNWRGKFADSKFSTMWSYSLYNLAKNQHWSLIALGNQLKLPNLTLQYDFKYSNEDLDNTGVLSTILGNEFSNRAKDVKYMEHWIRGEYFFAPRWSTTIMGMTTTNYWDGNPDANASDRIRTQWSFSAALEYHIFKPYNVKLFAAYVGRYNNFSDYARNTLNLSNNNTGQILVGIVSPLVLF